jgi:hypothetical protein
VNESSDILNFAITSTLDTANKENRFIQHDFKDHVNEIYHGLILGITKRLRKMHERPSRVMTEVTITNIKDHHEGKVDALLEYPGGYGLLDWKSYDLSKNISGREKWKRTPSTVASKMRYLLPSVAHFIVSAGILDFASSEVHSPIEIGIIIALPAGIVHLYSDFPCRLWVKKEAFPGSPTGHFMRW